MQANKVNEIPYKAEHLKEKNMKLVHAQYKRQKTTKNSQRLWLWKNVYWVRQNKPRRLRFVYFFCILINEGEIALQENSTMFWKFCIFRLFLTIIFTSGSLLSMMLELPDDQNHLARIEMSRDIVFSILKALYHIRPPVKNLPRASSETEENGRKEKWLQRFGSEGTA